MYVREWDESQHPREDDGKFGSGGGSGSDSGDDDLGSTENGKKLKDKLGAASGIPKDKIKLSKFQTASGTGVKVTLPKDATTEQKTKLKKAFEESMPKGWGLYSSSGHYGEVLSYGPYDTSSEKIPHPKKEKPMSEERIIKKVKDEWCVFTQDGSKNLGCHPSEAKAKEHLAAMEAGKADAAKKAAPVQLAKRATVGDVEKTGKPRTIRFVFSTDEPDRYNSIIRADGWDLEHYRRNPVFMFAHKTYELPIGKVNPETLQVRKVGNVSQLVGEVEFADAETYPFADTVYKLYDKGFLRGVSVGFNPTKVTRVTDDADAKRLGLAPGGVVHERQELWELSAAPVPGNAKTLKEELSAAAPAACRAVVDAMTEPVEGEDAGEWLAERLASIYEALRDVNVEVNVEAEPDATEEPNMCGGMECCPGCECPTCAEDAANSTPAMAAPDAVEKYLAALDERVAKIFEYVSKELAPLRATLDEVNRRLGDAKRVKPDGQGGSYVDLALRENAKFLERLKVIEQNLTSNKE